MSHANDTEAVARGRSAPTVHYTATRLREVLKGIVNAVRKRRAASLPRDKVRGDLETGR